MTDIDEQKRAEETLRRSEENLAIAQRVAQIGSWEMRLDEGVADADRHLAWSDETFRIFGVEPGSEQMTQARFFNFVPVIEHGALLSAGQEMMTESDRLSLEHRVILLDGRERIVHERARLIRREDGTPDKIIVLDFHMPDFNGLEGVRALKQMLPDAELVIFSGMRNDALVEQLFDAGAKSFVSKTEGGEVLLAAIQSAAEHKPFFTQHVSEILFARFMGDDRSSGSTRNRQVTKREREIIRHIADGRSNKEIAAALNISSRTAETHRATIQRKLGVSSTAEIVRFAIRNGIVEA